MDVYEVDLHNQTTMEAVETFIEFYNEIFRSTNFPPHMRAIHGFNHGTAIRTALREFLNQNGDWCLVIERERGHTTVVAKKPISRERL